MSASEGHFFGRIAPRSPLWLGHESIETTEIYLHADLATKERAIAKTAPPQTRQRRYRPPDALLSFLQAL